MAAQNEFGNDREPEAQPAAAPAEEVVDGRLITLAENIGWFLGVAQNRADNWLDREEVRREVNRIRSTAAQLLKHLNTRRSAAKSKSAGSKKKNAKAKSAAKARSGRGANVDAPGKRHRKPPPQQKLKRGATDSAVKKMGKKSPTTPKKFL